jgi:probable F420-dependent oxidoreductase
MDVGTIGIWSGPLRRADPGETAEAAAELEELGYGALWIPGGRGGAVFADVERLLAATSRVVVATGVLNLWMHDAAEAAAEHDRLSAAHGRRFLLGVGVSHHPAVEEAGMEYVRPLARTRSYLDALDAAPTPVPRDELVLAALGPRMLELARDRTAGAHPFLVTAEHTAIARGVLGAGPLLAPEQKVVLDTDADRARAAGRAALARYLALPNYTDNLRRLGFGDEDLSGGGSDRLVDAVVAWGDEERIADRLREHADAGADHVCIEVLGPDPGALGRDDWRRLAPALGGLW